MITKEELLEKYKEPIKIGALGSLQLVDVMGDDAAIAAAARCSYGDGTKTINDDENLIRYLIRHSHTSPVEMAEIKFLIQVPIHVVRQLIRHRTANVNEYSQRYSIAPKETEPVEVWCNQSTNNKQGRAEPLTEWPNIDLEEFAATIGPGWEEAFDDLQLAMQDGISVQEYLTGGQIAVQDIGEREYKLRLALGVAREQARCDLPLSKHTKLMWKIDLHNLLHFLRLRMDPHAQQEIRELATAMATIVADWTPAVWKAFEDYRLNSVSFSGPELEVIKQLLQVVDFRPLLQDALPSSKLSIRERKELKEKINALYG